MTTPRKVAAVAAPMYGRSDSAASTSKDIGEPPGSPAYFGASAAVGSNAPDATPVFDVVPDTGLGNPPGSAEYWGVDPATHAASRGYDGSELPLPTVGEQPGSLSYFGTGEG
jgi:hypothetical protein